MTVIKNIVFAADFIDVKDHVIKALIQFQQSIGGKIHLLKVNTPNNFETERQSKKSMMTVVRDYKLEDYTINVYNDHAEEDGIIYFAEDINADVIALGTHGRTGISHLISGSIAEDVVNHAKRPVWTMKINLG